jgi:hypothetical protein
MDALKVVLESIQLDFERKIPEFSMEYASFSGQRWGNMAEWETRLRVKGRGQAELFRRRGPGDSTEEPPGHYEGKISDPMLREFLDALAASGIQDYRSVAPGPWDPVDRLQFRLGGKAFEYTWEFSTLPVPLAVVRLDNLLIDWTLTACPKALWNLQLNVEGVECKANRLHGVLRIENRGSRSIHIVHPASPGMDDPFSLVLRYAQIQEEQEGYTASPPDVRFSPLILPSLANLELAEIHPDSPFRLEFSAILEGPTSLVWEGKIDFKHYLQEDVLAGIEVFNGAIFTESFTW